MLKKSKSFAFSPYQAAVLTWPKKHKGHLRIEAVAGSGKTFTLEHLVRRLLGNVVFLAFTRVIAEELQRRIGKRDNSTICTLNSMGYRILRDVFGGVQLREDKTRNIIYYQVFNEAKDGDDRRNFWRTHKFLIRAAALMKQQAVPPEEVEDRWLPLVEKYGVFIPDGYEHEQLGKWLTEVMEHTVRRTKTIDYDDQIYLPVILGLAVPTFDWVLVDEFQDLNRAQILLVKRLSGEDGRVVFVGDKRQAIFGFRGADTDAMDVMTDMLQAKQLPLSICYRCSKAVVRAAQRIVPYIEAAPNAKEGAEKVVDPSEFKKIVKPGDFVMSRCTAPLVTECLSFIRTGRKAYVKGRDIGEGLIDLLHDIIGKDVHASIRDSINEYRAAQTEKLLGKGHGNESAIIELNDRCDTLAAVVDYRDTLKPDAAGAVPSVEDLIKQVFSESADAVVFLTMHRVKGLEANNTFIIAPELLPHPNATLPWQIEQEINLEYVALTRAKDTVHWVSATPMDPSKRVYHTTQAATTAPTPPQRKAATPAKRKLKKIVRKPVKVKKTKARR